MNGSRYSAMGVDRHVLVFEQEVACARLTTWISERTAFNLVRVVHPKNASNSFMCTSHRNKGCKVPCSWKVGSSQVRDRHTCCS